MSTIEIDAYAPGGRWRSSSAGWSWKSKLRPMIGSPPAPKNTVQANPFVSVRA